MTKEEANAIKSLNEFAYTIHGTLSTGEAKIILNLIEEKDKELQMLKDFKEIANSKVTDLNPIRISKSKSIDK